MNKRKKHEGNLTLIGIFVVIFIPAALLLILLGKLGLLRNPFMQFARYIVPIPESQEIELVTRGVDNIVGNGDGFTFDESTAGYELYKSLSKGCPRKDCIPSIDTPVFESVQEADSWLTQDSLVLLLKSESEIHVYPLAILNWHEIVNDTLSGIPVTVTYCPLCGSATAFDRRVKSGNEELTLTFGVSGYLHNSDVVMYDRETESLWTQLLSQSVVGELEGTELKQLPVSVMQWSDVVSAYSDSSLRVLSRSVGEDEDYDLDPYGDYALTDIVSFPVEGGIDTTINPKDVVYGVTIAGQSRAYPRSDIIASESIVDILGSTKIELSYENGEVFVRESATENELVATRVYWFAWFAFNPDTQLFQN